MIDNSFKSIEPMLEMFVFETNQLIEQLEEILMNAEKDNTLSHSSVNEIFRIMHTIKGSSAMMMFNNISTLAHSLEDLFFCIREHKALIFDYSFLADIVLQSADFIKNETSKIESGNSSDGNAEAMIERIKKYLQDIKLNDSTEKTLQCKQTDVDENAKYYISTYTQKEQNSQLNQYIAKLFFEDGCQMENIRAYTVIHSLREHCINISHEPEDILSNEDSIETIRTNGFEIKLTTHKNKNEIFQLLDQTLFLEKLELDEFIGKILFPADEDKSERELTKLDLANDNIELPSKDCDIELFRNEKDIESKLSNTKQNIISVNVQKLDMLMDLVGEIVISEAMVTRNPDLDGLQMKLDNFNKASRQLRKLTNELQDIVMSIRMIPVSGTFNKMHRIVRDISRKLSKDIELILIGEDTELDKNIIDHLSDPLMHLIRNAADHGIETKEERMGKDKPEKGKITLEARNSGGDVWIIIKDDGKGLNRNKILQKAKAAGLLNKEEHEYTEKEVFNFILLPGFSTKEVVSEFSGRGVGMDVVRENIEKIGGTINIDSVQDKSTTIAIKIPLTLAIIDGMLVSIGNSRFIIPTTAIRESFKAQESQIIEDSEGNEMIMIRGECYSVIRVHKKFKIKTKVLQLLDGIMVMVEDGESAVCLFADELIGEQQVVVKPIPAYIKKIKGISGCTIQGDGSISLIFDLAGLLK